MAYCWPFSSHNCHTRDITVNIFPTELLVYRSAIYPQWKTFKYDLGGRLGKWLPIAMWSGDWHLLKWSQQTVTIVSINYNLPEETRLNGTVARLLAWVLGGIGSRVQVGVRFLYKLEQPPNTFISYSSLSVAQLLVEITLKSFIFISYHGSCYLCRLHIQKKALLLSCLSYP